MIRIGRTVINPDKVIKVTRDGDRKHVRVEMEGGVTVTYVKYAEAAWKYFKSVATTIPGGSPETVCGMEANED
jgi:hypothetical protein